MQAGVASSKIFLLFLSEGVLTRPFCLFEISTAIELQKRLMLMHETDGRHGAFDFGADEVKNAPPQVSQLLLDNESLPWRRRRFEQDGIITELIKLSGLTPGVPAPSAAPAAAAEQQAAPPAAAEPALGRAGRAVAGLAPVPDSVPVLPDTLSPRVRDQELILDVLLARTPEMAAKARVLAHGMGGLGKTTLAAATARNEAVRQAFARIGFVSCGQEPPVLELQRQLFAQLTGSPMEVSPEGTAGSQKELLVQASVGKAWLAILDDIWGPEQERQLNFVEPASAPDAKVLVTTRFARLLPGYVEVALGLLTEPDAVDLLLGTAEVSAPTSPQAAASRTIAKAAGYLPLFLGILGRLIYEFGSSSAWEVEVIALLEESKASVLGGADDLGSSIVGSSLAHLDDDDARRLFSAMAVLPEDVPAPMAALELIWCSSTTGQPGPPLTRLAKMKLRKCCFKLLDRNLVLGETTEGVFMHDLVRDFCQASTPADALQLHQRRLVALLIAAAPARGWVSTSPEPLSVYVHQALRWHMSAGIIAGSELTADREAFGWLSGQLTDITANHVMLCAANAIGPAALLTEAGHLAGAGEPFTAGLYTCCAALTDANSAGLGGSAPRDVSAATRTQLIERAVALCARGDGSDVTQRTAELGMRTLLITTLQFGGKAWMANMRRIETLWSCPPGVHEPDTLENCLNCGMAAGWGMNLHAGFISPIAGTHLDRASCSKAALALAKANQLEFRAMAMLEHGDPRRYGIVGGFTPYVPAFGPLWCDSGVDIRSTWTHEVIVDVARHFDWPVHHPLAIKLSKTGFNGVVNWSPTIWLTVHYCTASCASPGTGSRGCTPRSPTPAACSTTSWRPVQRSRSGSACSAGSTRLRLATSLPVCRASSLRRTRCTLAAIFSGLSAATRRWTAWCCSSDLGRRSPSKWATSCALLRRTATS